MSRAQAPAICVVSEIHRLLTRKLVYGTELDDLLSLFCGSHAKAVIADVWDLMLNMSRFGVDIGDAV